MINIIQGNDFKIIVNVKYVTTEQDDHTVQVVQDYDLRGSSDIHAYLTKVNNAAQCEDRYEINCEVDTVQSNVLIMYMNETYPVGSYGLEITGVSEYGENWRFKAKQGELFNVVASTSGARYESSDYIKLDAQIGVLGINTPSQMILENCQVLIDDAIDEVNDTIDTLDIKVDSNKNFLLGVINDNYSALDSKIDENEADFESKHASLTNLCNTLSGRVMTAQANINALTNTVNTNEADIEDKMTALTNTVASNKSDIEATVDALEAKVDANETDIETKVTNLTNSLDTRIRQVIGTAPAALDTLGEIADKLSDNDDAVSALVTSISNETTRATAAEQANAANITSLSNTLTALSNTVNANETDIEDKHASLTNTVDGIASRVTTNEGNISTLNTRVNAIPQVLDENFETPTNIQEGTAPEAGDTFQEAIQTLTNTIADNAETWADAFNSVNTSVGQLATVATSGDYDDLINKPTIPTVPTNVSSFTNDAGYLTQHQDISGKADTADLKRVAFTGSYNDLTNKPTNVSPIASISIFKTSIGIRFVIYIVNSITGVKLCGGIDIQSNSLSDYVNYFTNNGYRILFRHESNSYAESDDAGWTILGNSGSEGFIVYQGELYYIGSRKRIEMKVTKNVDYAPPIGYGIAYFPTIPAAQIQSNWNQTNTSSKDYIKNKPELFSGDYNDLTNKPTIPTVPTNVSDFTNDAGYLTSHQDISGKANSSDLATVATSGSYNDLINKPTIPTVPTNVSAFTNDAGYLTQHQSLSNYYTKAEIDALLANLISISGTNMTIS